MPFLRYIGGYFQAFLVTDEVMIGQDIKSRFAANTKTAQQAIEFFLISVVFTAYHIYPLNRCNVSSSTCVPHSSVATGIRSSAAWIVLMSSSGICIGMKP